MLSLCALAIGGLDPGGGAGILADLRAFHATGVFGCAVASLVTVQSTDGLLASKALDAQLVIEQAEEVMRAQRVRAIKIGALGSLENVRAVASWLSRTTTVPIVLDPVMAATRGTPRLLSVDALTAMRDELIPRATLVTANAPEAAMLTGHRVETRAEAKRAARELVEMGARAALVKGGHWGRLATVADILALRDDVGDEMLEFRSKRLAVGPIHGGGCILASLIAGHLARVESVPRLLQISTAVAHARRFHQRALRRALDVGGAARVLIP